MIAGSYENCQKINTKDTVIRDSEECFVVCLFIKNMFIIYVMSPEIL